MQKHDASKFARSLGAKLASRSRHVCMFLGAGVGKACGLPDVADLQEKVLADLAGPERAALEAQLVHRDLEGVLSRTRRIAGLISGDATVDNLTADAASRLDASICQAIVKALGIATADSTAVRLLAEWAKRSNYLLPLELFTVNYDLLLEEALESTKAPYFDGFVGTLKARFHTDLVEQLPGADLEALPAFFVRLWKLHGSVNWAWDDGGHIIRLGEAVQDGRAAAIYPSDMKYEESRRVPFVVLQDRLRRALNQPETLLLVAGYSFGDQHLNEHIFDAASRRPRSEFVAFCYDEIPETLATHAGIIPNLQVLSPREAIIAGIRQAWAAPQQAPNDIWSDDHFALCDFRNLACYLARSTTRDYERDPTLEALLDRLSHDSAVPGEEGEH